MPSEEVWCTPLGEMDDLITCYAIAKGLATEKRKPIVMKNDVPDID